MSHLNAGLHAIGRLIGQLMILSVIVVLCLWSLTVPLSGALQVSEWIAKATGANYLWQLGIVIALLISMRFYVFPYAAGPIKEALLVLMRGGTQIATVAPGVRKPSPTTESG